MKPLHPPLRTGGRARAPREDHIDALARSFGNALRFVQRLMPRPRKLVGAAPRPKSLAPMAVAADQASAAPSGLLPIRQRLAREVEELEGEVERLHGMITNGAALPATGAEDRASALNDLIRRSREVRERLYEARQELSRIDRHIARERRLAGQEPEEPAPKPRPARAARGRPPPARARGATAAALEGEDFTDRTQRLAITRLADDLGNEDADVRRNAALRLGELDASAAAKLLLGAVDDASERVQLAVLNGLGRTGHPAATAVFRRFLKHESAALRLAAFRGLAAASSEALSGTDLMAALEDPDPSVRKAAATALGWRRADRTSARVYAALGFALRDEQPEVRVAAAEALGNLGDGRAALSLMRALDDPSGPVRDAALGALRGVLGEDIDRVGAGLDPAARIVALKRWWREARVDQSLPREGAIPPPEAEAPEPAPAPPPKRSAPPKRAPSASPKRAASAPPKRASSKAPPPEIPAKAEAAGEPDAKFVNVFEGAESAPPPSAPPAASPAEAEGAEGFPDLFGGGGEDAVEGDEPAAGAGEEYESIFGDNSE